MTLDCEVVQTRSGARAMRDRLTGELMHPLGPLSEAQRLYVDASELARRLEYDASDPLVVWDVGLGAASNASRAWLCSESRLSPRRHLRIISFDRSLAALDLALQLEHSEDFGLGGSVGDAARALLCHGRHQTPQTEWELRLGELDATLHAAREEPADIVFWDPFSPRANPELWTVGAFSAVRRACRAGATLHTYSGATSVRSGLLLAGFAVGLGEPISKGRCATIAATSCEALQNPLDRRWFERLRRSSAAFPLDAPADALERIGALGQFARSDASPR
ncbi:MAG TPA: MnmC family methyltransferase [Polyangiaceae bacterium]|nr:MnmC family methyltransferase [Polyangiaceae bacterium]